MRNSIMIVAAMRNIQVVGREHFLMTKPLVGIRNSSGMFVKTRNRFELTAGRLSRI